MPAPLAILLDSPRNCWTSGDHISGKVVLSSLKDESVGRVTITLFGRAKAKIIDRNGNNRRIVRSRATLVSEGLELYSSHFTLRKDVYEWPFEFVMPASAQRIPSEAWEQGGAFNHEPGHLLPPTMAFTGEGVFGARLFECFTEYKLLAKLDRPTKDQSFFNLDSGYETEIPLSYEQPRMATPVLPTSFNHNAIVDIRSFLLDPSHSTKFTFKEKMKSTFNSSSLPSSIFAIKLTIPTVVNLGGSMCIGLHLKHDTERSTAPTTPEVNAQISVTLTKQVAVRADRVFLTDHGKSSTQGIFFHTFPTCVLNKECGYSHDFTLDPIEARNCEPSFGTYNITQDYVLELTCAITCVDKKEKTIRGTRLVIYPRVEGQTSVPGVVSLEYTPESLPSYTEAADASSSRGPIEASQDSPAYQFGETDKKH